MQMYADVLGKNIKIAGSTQAGAKGSAIFASVAGGYFKDINQAVEIMADKPVKEYVPNSENTKKYAKLYSKYADLSNYFAKDSDIMKKLKYEK